MAINKMHTQYMEQQSRPLDFLNSMKGQRVLVELTSGDLVSGCLRSFDIHINLVLDDAAFQDRLNKPSKSLFLRGENVKSVSA